MWIHRTQHPIVVSLPQSKVERIRRTCPSPVGVWDLRFRIKGVYRHSDCDRVGARTQSKFFLAVLMRRRADAEKEADTLRETVENLRIPARLNPKP